MLSKVVPVVENVGFAVQKGLLQEDKISSCTTRHSV